ncbi:MAG: inverse autotransporter beta domain-containing protein [Verrucomicrobiota bacterium]|nr:inverse autotransporter beta domain-containing protein [Verrucomicrobiota bacterium]
MKIRVVLCAAILSGFATSHAEEGICADGKQQDHVAIRHIESGGIGYEDGYTTLEAFFASDPSKWTVTPFLDVRGHVFNNGKWAANVGVGLRTLSKNRAYGINTYYDYRNTSRLHSNQVGVGLETLGELFDFRINGYLPVGAKTSAPYGTTFWAFSGHYMLLSQKYQSAMKGSDAEFGFHFGKSDLCDFYAAVGPYYFIGQKAPTTWGGKARIAGTFKDILTLEISDSYDRTFHNKFQGQISLNFSFGPKSKIKEQRCNCTVANQLNDRMLQPVSRQEIIVIDKTKRHNVAIDPATGLPYFFVFVNNTSSSNGTYESPYHSLIQAQDNSSPNDIIYVFPGDGTTRGMDSGIALQANQKFWGSGVSHPIKTTEGVVSIPAQSSSWPTITNTNIDTDGNAITLALNNAISGFNIASAMNDAIYGTDIQSLDVSFCTITDTTTYVIEASSSQNASISITNNQFLNNVNGVFLTLNGTSTVVCSENTFQNQTSISSVPFEISASNNTLDTYFTNNIFSHNTTGSIRFNFDNVISSDNIIDNNTFTSNGAGAQSSLGSNIVVIANGTNRSCSIALGDNTFSDNASSALYMHTSGMFTSLEATVSGNTINGSSGLVFATPVDDLTLVATNNAIIGGGDNGIAIISSGVTLTGAITINNNTISDIVNSSNGVSISQNFSVLNLTLLNNAINNCQGTGILSYSLVGIDSLTMNISGNAISNCQNLSSNASSGIDIEQYTDLTGSVTNNTLTDNTGVAVVIGSGLSSPTACLTLTGNHSSTDYLLTNPGDGHFNLSPCNVDAANVGTINTSGVIDLVQSCSNPVPCP